MAYGAAHEIKMIVFNKVFLVSLSYMCLNVRVFPTLPPDVASGHVREGSGSFRPART